MAWLMISEGKRWHWQLGVLAIILPSPQNGSYIDSTFRRDKACMTHHYTLSAWTTHGFGMFALCR
jgi:hypothetical protein